MNRLTNRLATVTAGLMIALLFALPARAQITFPSASPISAGNLIVRTQPTVTEYSGGLQSFYDENILLYGASPDLAFILENKSIVSNSGNIVSNGKAAAFTATGFGDTVLDTRYNRFFAVWSGEKQCQAGRLRSSFPASR